MLLENALGFGILIGYFVVMVASLLVLRRHLTLPQELFRKMLHIVVVLSVIVFLYGFHTWYAAAISAVALIALIYPVLYFAELLPGYSAFFAERSSGEVRTSLIAAFLMEATLIAVFWGLRGAESKFIILAAVMAWGFGDAAAALIGKYYGRRYITHRRVDGKKTLEGTLAMYGVSLLAITVTLSVSMAQPWYVCLGIGLVVAPICAAVELFTRRGMDTVTVPFAAAAAVFALTILLEHMGL